jgi:hypothetical protein
LIDLDTLSANIDEARALSARHFFRGRGGRQGLFSPRGFWICNVIMFSIGKFIVSIIKFSTNNIIINVMGLYPQQSGWKQMRWLVYSCSGVIMIWVATFASTRLQNAEIHVIFES